MCICSLRKICKASTAASDDDDINREVMVGTMTAVLQSIMMMMIIMMVAVMMMKPNYPASKVGLASCHGFCWGTLAFAMATKFAQARLARKKLILLDFDQYILAKNKRSFNWQF